MAVPARNTCDNSSSEVSLSLEQKIDLLLSEVAEIKSANAKFHEDIKEMKDDIKKFKKDINDSLICVFRELKKIKV